VTDLFSIRGKTALVTGGSRGIGEMIVRGYVDAGVKVYLSSRKADVCEALAEELRDQGGDVTALPADLSSEHSCAALAGELEGKESRLDILVGSIDGLRVPALETYSYSASKAAVHQLTRHLAKRLAPEITVNAIAPGPFPSKMMRTTLEAFGDQIAAAAPMKRIGRAPDMAGAAIYLASPAASYVTGAVLPVDGGIAALS